MIHTLTIFGMNVILSTHTSITVIRVNNGNYLLLVIIKAYLHYIHIESMVFATRMYQYSKVNILYLFTTVLYFLYSTLSCLWQVHAVLLCLRSSHTKYNKANVTNL